MTLSRSIRASMLGCCLGCLPTFAGGAAPRQDVDLDVGWRTALAATAADPGSPASGGDELPDFDDRAWRPVDVPHNWDEYQGFHQLRAGNLHGTAWYRRSFAVPAADRGRRVFLWFEGVGSYATVWVNGHLVGRHAGGLTTFTLDITAAVNFGGDNVVAVRADHPWGIRDLPWVDGGSELAPGFSEGPQPFGIFRPVHLVITAPVRIEPFGVHVWNDDLITAGSAAAHARTTIRNYGDDTRTLALVTQVLDRSGAVAAAAQTDVKLASGQTVTIAQEPPAVARPHLWSPADPYRYTLRSTLLDGDTVLDQVDTPFGFRWIQWPDPRGPPDQPFRINGRPFFINGIADYEHLLGDNYAFSAAQIRARVREIEAAGFNAFRDAHYPHNLRFQASWDHDGLLWWPQFSTHIWFDNDAFRANFLANLREWVKERRNSPSLVLWGLQNESALPAGFAAECAAVIRALDPTATTQRLITTCNGGAGTDWNVPQNWSGTYGGDPARYAGDLRRDRLVGEYGAWRSLGLHTEGGFVADGPLSENRMCALLETKIRLAESVRERVCGQFAWIFETHANPGRTVGEHGEQFADGIRPLDQIGPANNKGLFTIWGEPTDAYYLYRANYTPAATQPMVYIVSHTWPDRWTAPGRKSGLVVYSNCDEVELFNDVGHDSLGRRVRIIGPALAAGPDSRRGMPASGSPTDGGPAETGRGTHFEWDDVPIRYNVLYAEGRVGGKVVARDCLLLHFLPPAPHLAELEAGGGSDPTAPLPGQHYLYRVNCGGPEFVDSHGHAWLADRDYRPGDAWGALSWADAYPNLSPRFGSQRRIYDPVAGTADGALFQAFRYGRDQLRYRFSVPDGRYEVELFFIEPWYGTGGGLDCTGWRQFDVAINGATRLRDVDLWREAGRARAVKKVLPVEVRGGRIEVSFPRVAAGQAVISAIAISTAKPDLPAPALPPPLVHDLRVADATHAAARSVRTHLDTGDRQFADAPGEFARLPGELLDADWLQGAAASAGYEGSKLLRFELSRDAHVLVAFDRRAAPRPAWLDAWSDTGETLTTTDDGGATFALYRRPFAAGDTVILGPAGRAHLPYSVFVTPRRPPAPPQLIAHFAAADPRWRAAGGLRDGDAPYVDATATFARLPSLLAGGDWIQTASDTARPSASFGVSGDAEVYVALDARLTARPAWLAGWIDTNLTLAIPGSGAPRFRLLMKRFAPGETVDLGGNGTLADGRPAAMYSVIVRPVRPATRYELAAARSSGGTVVSAIDGAPGSVWQSGAAGSHLEWTVTIGVSDRYGLDFRYATAATTTVPMELSLIDREGHVLRTDRLAFPPASPPLTWATLRTRTHTSLNAGTYRIRLTAVTATPIFLGPLEVE